MDQNKKATHDDMDDLIKSISAVKIIPGGIQIRAESVSFNGKGFIPNTGGEDESTD